MRRIRCKETGEIFKSLGAASRWVGSSTGNISRNLAGSPVKGYNFEDVK